jgi:hypothetical protein
VLILVTKAIMTDRRKGSEPNIKISLVLNSGGRVSENNPLLPSGQAFERLVVRILFVLTREVQQIITISTNCCGRLSQA